MNDTLKQYLQEVKILLPCSSREKQRCITELEADASAFLENHPNATLEELYSAIGSPQSIAESFMARTDPEQLSHRLSVKRRIAVGIITIAVILAIVVGAIVAVTSYKRHNFYDGYFVDTVEELPSNAEPVPAPLTEN